MEKNNELRSFIQNHGYPIYGTDDFALKFNDALFAIKFAEMLDVLILGGDVYHLENYKLISTYENWYFEKNENENENDFYKRSWKESETYIKKSIRNSELELLFVLVI